MRHSRRTMLSAASVGLGVAAVLGGVVPSATAATPAGGSPASYAAYERSQENQAANKAFFEAVQRAVAEQRAANPSATAVVTVTYNTRNAPSFRTQIANSTRIWNGSVSNVKLQEVSSAGTSRTTRATTPGGRTRARTGTAGATSSWTTRRTSSTTPPV